MHHSPGHYISSAYRHLQIYLNNRFSAFGFGSGQYLFFNHIAHNEGITQKELSRQLAVDKATAAKAVHKLCRLGYIEQRQNILDKRYNNLFISDKGRSILPEVRKILFNTRDILQSGMNKEEQQQMLRLLDLLLENLTAEVDKIRRTDD